MADKTTKKENTETKETAEPKKAKETEKPTCGIVMPISDIDSYTAEHWLDVKQILLDVIDSAGFTGSLVSEAEETSIIQKTIVQNVYNNDLVICDVSGKNPNVMFELGMRLAFDKATIIIKDNITDYSFDTSPIEHLTYQRDLRFPTIVDFKEKLKNKIIATYKTSKADANYSTFLKSFGEFKIAHLESKEISPDEFIIESLKDLTKKVNNLSQSGVGDRNALMNDLIRQSYREAKNKSEKFISGIELFLFSENATKEESKTLIMMSELLGKDLLYQSATEKGGAVILEFLFIPKPPSFEQKIQTALAYAGITSFSYNLIR